MNRTYYLNNKQTKWVVYDNNGNKVKKEFTTKSGKKIKRTVQYYEYTCYGTVCAI